MSTVPDLVEVPGLLAPDARGEEAEWFARCAERRLTFQRCSRCGQPFFPPRGACPFCGSTSLLWEDSTGTGTVYSFTIQRRPTRPGLPDPTVLALIDLDDGFRMLSLVLAEPESVAIGTRLEVAFAAAGSGLVPVFVPCS
jgi:uncharacterized OB-fold protein